jgi:hypothetical protein
MNCFQNYQEKLGLSIFPKLSWIVSKTTWKFRPPQYFQVVLEIFPSSFGNVSCIENAFGTVNLSSIHLLYIELLVPNCRIILTVCGMARSRFSLSNQIEFLREFVSIFKTALAHESGDPGVPLNEKKPRVKNLVILYLCMVRGAFWRKFT